VFTPRKWDSVEFAVELLEGFSLAQSNYLLAEKRIILSDTELCIVIMFEDIYSFMLS
jgi:hypothetical protein